MAESAVSDEVTLETFVAELYAACADLCLVLAQDLNESSGLPSSEPGIDIAEFDATFGVQRHQFLSDPPKASHEMATTYLRSAGELLYAVGALLTVSPTWVGSPGVLARSVAVHSAQAYRISDPRLTALERCNLALYLARSAWLPEPEVREEFVDDIDKWISRHGVGKPKDITQEERLVASMFDEEVMYHNSMHKPGQRRLSVLLDDNFYARLSRLVHGDMTTFVNVAGGIGHEL